ncbi:MAG: restriction endonuclease subunit S [candidate division FCPU426 bacterium]
MTIEAFFEKFNLFADAPDAMTKMRELVLQLAVTGKVVEQEPSERSALDCIRNANKSLIDFIPDKSMKVPEGWVALPLGCLIASNTGGGTPSKDNPVYWNGDIPWASVKDIKNDKYLVSTIDSITEQGLKNSSSNLIPPDRLLVVTRMGLGKLAINRIPVAINQDLRAIEPTEALDLDFAYLLFKSLKMVGSGVTVKGITMDKLHEMPVYLPPLAEQKRIVAKVDELMTLCDRLEAQQKQREEKKVALARASLARFADAPTPTNLTFIFHKSYDITPADLRKTILTLAVQGKLVPQDPNDVPVENLLSRIKEEKKRLELQKAIGRDKEWLPEEVLQPTFELPASWVFSTLSDIGLINPRNEAMDDLDTSFVPMKLISAKWRAPHEHETRKWAEIKTGFTHFAEGDVSLAKITPCFENGKSAVMRSLTNGIGAGTTELHIVRPIFVEADYILIYLKSSYFIEGGIPKMTGTAGQKRVPTSYFASAPFPLPPLAEQHRIVAKVDELMALVDELETKLTASRAAGEKLLTALVAELTAGKESHAAA